MNSVAFAERSKVARHEASHASACLFLGVVPDSISITPAPEGGGYTQGLCTWGGKRSVDILATAVGVLDGHGIGTGDGEGDLYKFEQLVPDYRERDRIRDVARRVMEHRQFKTVRDALRTRLQFRDVLYRDEIERIAASVTGFPNAEPPSNGTAAVPNVATSARRPRERRGVGFDLPPYLS